MSPGVVAIEYVLPPGSFSLQELADAELLASSPGQLQDFGFDRCYISNEPADELALRAAAALIKNTDVEPDSIDLLLSPLGLRRFSSAQRELFIRMLRLS